MERCWQHFGRLLTNVFPTSPISLSNTKIGILNPQNCACICRTQKCVLPLVTSQDLLVTKQGFATSKLVWKCDVEIWTFLHTCSEAREVLCPAVKPTKLRIFVSRLNFLTSMMSFYRNTADIKQSIFTPPEICLEVILIMNHPLRQHFWLICLCGSFSELQTDLIHWLRLITVQ